MKRFFLILLATLATYSSASGQQKEIEKPPQNIQTLCRELEKNIILANSNLNEANKLWIEKQYGKNKSENPEVYERARNASISILISLEETWSRLGCVHLIRVN